MQDELELCRKEVGKLAKEIQSAQKIMMEKKKYLKEEQRVRQLARTEEANHLREKIEELMKEERALINRITVLTGVSENFTNQSKELTSKVIKLKKEVLNDEQGPPEKRMRLNTTASHASTSHAGNIEERKKLLTDVEENLAAVETELAYTVSRIQEFIDKKLSNTLKLGKMRVDMESMVGNPVGEARSAAASQLQKLVQEQRIRIERVCELCRKMTELESKAKFDEIERKREGMLEALNSYEDE